MVAKVWQQPCTTVTGMLKNCFFLVQLEFSFKTLLFILWVWAKSYWIQPCQDRSSAQCLYQYNHASSVKRLSSPLHWFAIPMLNLWSSKQIRFIGLKHVAPSCRLMVLLSHFFLRFVHSPKLYLSIIKQLFNV